MIGYINGQFLPEEEIRISPYDRGFLFGDGVYEVVLVSGGRAFELGRHIERIERNLGLLMIRPACDLASLCGELLARNRPCPDPAVIYVQITRGVAPRSHAFPGAEVAPTIYGRVTPVTLAPERRLGVRAILVPDIRWYRCNIKTVNLLPNVMATEQARVAGVDEALFVRERYVTESARANFAAIFDGQLFTHPLDECVLPGITRAVSLELARNASIPVYESAVPVDRLAEAEECMLFSTTDMVTPVIEIDGHPVGTGERGPVTTLLQDQFRALLER